MSKHTPTPWVHEGGDARPSQRDKQIYHADVVRGGLRVARVAGVGEDNATANAEFIVRACNSYDQLVKALGECVNALNEELGAAGEDERAENPVLANHMKVAERAERVLKGLQ